VLLDGHAYFENDSIFGLRSFGVLAFALSLVRLWVDLVVTVIHRGPVMTAKKSAVDLYASIAGIQ